MKNKKGFTLIELLAVIVILAVIALIATPIIMNVIHDSKKGAAKDAMYGYVKAVELSAVREVTPTKNALSGTYTIKDGNLYNGNTKVLDVTVKGTKPKDGGTITLENGKVTDANINFGDITVDYDNGKAEIVEKENPDSSPSPTAVPSDQKAIFKPILSNSEITPEFTSLFSTDKIWSEIKPRFLAAAKEVPSRLLIDNVLITKDNLYIQGNDSTTNDVLRVKFDEPGYAMIQILCYNKEQVAGPIYPVDMCLNYQTRLDLNASSSEMVFGAENDMTFPQYGDQYGDHEFTFVKIEQPGYVNVEFSPAAKNVSQYSVITTKQTVRYRVIFIKENEMDFTGMK